MVRGSLKLKAAAMLFAGALCCPLRAQELVAPMQDKGTHDRELWFGFVPAQHDGSTSFNTDFWMGGVRFGRVLSEEHGPGWLRGTLQWDLDFVPLFAVSGLQNTYGAEFDPVVLRWNFRHHGQIAPYLEAAGGIAFTTEKVPAPTEYTSRWNVLAKIGPGWQIMRRERQSIDIGVRAWHLSNAWTATRNPSANGIQVTLGYHWFHSGRQAAANQPHTSDSAGAK